MRDNIKTWLIAIILILIYGFLMQQIIKIVFSFYGLMIAILLFIIYILKIK